MFFEPRYVSRVAPATMLHIRYAVLFSRLTPTTRNVCIYTTRRNIHDTSVFVCCYHIQTFCRKLGIASKKLRHGLKFFQSFTEQLFCQKNSISPAIGADKLKNSAGTNKTRRKLIACRITHRLRC